MDIKKIISLILAVIMVLGVLASCAAGSDEPYVISRPDGDSGSADDNFAKANYDGEDFTFVTIQSVFNGRDYYGGNFIDSDSYTGETISDAVYQRNLEVEERYGVNIVERKEEGEPSTVLQQFYMAGDFCFDAIYGWCYKLGNCIVNNFFADFNDLPTADLTAEYWSPSAIDGLSINGKLYLTLSDITMNKLEWSHFYFFNKDIYEDYNLESEFGSVYDLVDEGKWTLDTFLNMVHSVSTDLDGDGKITKDDTYGLLGGTSPDQVYSCGINLTRTNEDGSFSLDCYSEKLLDIITKIHTMLDGNLYNVTETGENDGNYTDVYEYSRSFFAKGNALFLPGTANITLEFRNMEDDYGILPYPKYDEYQKNYITTWEYNAALFAIPSTVRQDVSTASMERTSNVLEYMSYKSNEILLPQYYDTLLKGQRLNGDDDSRMLDIVRTTLTYEITSAVGIYTAHYLIGSILERPATATSMYKRNEKKMQKEIDDFYNSVVSLETLNKTEE